MDNNRLYVMFIAHGGMERAYDGPNGHRGDGNGAK